VAKFFTNCFWLVHIPFNALTLVVGWQEGHPAHENLLKKEDQMLTQVHVKMAVKWN